MNGSICVIVAFHNILSALEKPLSAPKKTLKITLRHNVIRELEARTFESVLNLHHLYLGYNSIQYVNGSLFRKNELLIQRYFRTTDNYINWI
jgi:hypothetical protein